MIRALTLMLMVAVVVGCAGVPGPTASAARPSDTPGPSTIGTPTSSTPLPATAEPATLAPVTPQPTPEPATPEPATPEPSTPQPELFVLTSPAFAEGEPIPSRYTCDGADDQLPLEWQGTPAGTVELALIQHDPDAGGFVHWVVVGIPADATTLADPLPAGARHGINGFGKARYNGPCPPSGNHTYVTTLFALSASPELSQAPSAREVRQAIGDITIAKAQLQGTYRRK